jgi:hypothetical protein
VRAQTLPPVDPDIQAQEAAMNTTESPDIKHYRAVAVVTRSIVLMGVIAGLFAIGATAPNRSVAALDCTYAAAPAAILTDAGTGFPDACANAGPASARPAAPEARHGVPDAKTALDPRAEAEPLPATF